MFKQWRTTVCYFDENRKVVAKQRIDSGEYVIEKKEQHYKEEPPQTIVRIINYTVKRNPQNQIIFGGVKEGPKENLASINDVQSTID